MQFVNHAPALGGRKCLTGSAKKSPNPKNHFGKVTFSAFDPHFYISVQCPSVGLRFDIRLDTQINDVDLLGVGGGGWGSRTPGRTVVAEGSSYGVLLVNEQNPEILDFADLAFVMIHIGLL